MPLLKTWAPYFQSRARQHGRKCYHDGCVKRIAPHKGELIRATVDCDGHMHTVTFRADGPGTSASCSCLQETGGSFCRHIWATLAAIQHNGQLFAQDAQASDLTNPRPTKARRRRATQKSTRTTEPLWSTKLDLLRPTGLELDQSAPAIPAHYEVCYVIRPELSARYGRLVVELRHRQTTLGGYSRPTRLKISQKNIDQIPDLTDRQLCATLLGADPALGVDDDHDGWNHESPTSLFVLPKWAQRDLLIRMIQTGRCFARGDDLDGQQDSTLSWSGDSPWVLWITGQYDNQNLQIDIELRRGDDRVSVDEPDLLLAGTSGVVIYEDQAAPFDDHGADRWVSQFHGQRTWPDHESPSITVATEDIPRFLDRLYRLPQLPRIDLPKQIGPRQIHVQPTPHIELRQIDAQTSSDTPNAQRNQLAAHVWFTYGQQRVTPGQPGQFISVAGPPEKQVASDPQENGEDGQTAPLIRRDLSFETQAITSLWPLGFRRSTAEPTSIWLPRRLMPDTVNALIERRWTVIADQRQVHAPQAPELSVTSGIDWFELRGSFSYQTTDGRQEIPLPEVLAAARAGKTMLTLRDGSRGMLPDRWIEHSGLLTTIGKLDKDHLRFKSTQVVILDSLLNRQTRVNVDHQFEMIRNRLRQYRQVVPADPAASFQGQLRPYQRQGLGWLRYLRWLTIGGILADDMGLGKTVQVLAMLHRVYHLPDDQDSDRPVHRVHCEDRHGRLPSLIVVPRSIVFNWMNEANRFAPELRVQAYTGTDRQALRHTFADQDVIITSYGMMRRDIAELTNHHFEYVVLDEAQAIKNPTSQSAKAARLLNGRHHLALTGTPVENHLGDLWSIFEFLNPGMLGSNTRFAQLIRSAGKPGRGRTSAVTGDGERATDRRTASSKTRHATQIAGALKPFILRRTKQQVLNDLPEKTEQTLLCQMEPHQRKIYDQLLRHYRGVLLGHRAKKPGASSLTSEKTMIVLEALLRLRQAACHPGLINPDLADESSAKLDVLLDRIQDLIEEKHKALVFSQFTSMLTLVRKQLDTRGLIYEYLDGKSRNRGQAVERFQTDPHCPLFLISLKAGGLGLNLTAAEYVFILDPWWNPAVEAQAIDRAHRIGQTNPVFAYRLICQDSVEQRIAQLQEKKRRLADAIVGGQENLLRSMTHEDLQYLLT